MREKTKRWGAFALGLALGAGGTTTAIVAGDCSPVVEITQEVLDAYCTGREPHACPSPCPAVPVCPSPCLAPEPCCTGEPEIRIVPGADPTISIPAGAGTWGDEGVDWTWVEPEGWGKKLEVDWSVVTAPDFDQTVAAFAFRWKEEQAWRPMISASWTRGRSGSESMICSDFGWDYDDDEICSTTIVVPVEADWRVLLGVGGTFGK